MIHAVPGPRMWRAAAILLGMDGGPPGLRPAPRRRLAAAVGAVVALVALAVLTPSWFAADVLSRPQRSTGPRTPADAGAPRFDEVTLRSADDAADLAAWVLPVEGSELGVVLVHGRNSSKGRELGGGFVDLAVALQAQGYQVLALDLRGHGASGDGRFGYGLLERFDVIAGVHHLVVERGVRPGGVGLVGVSLGGAAALMAAAVDGRVGAVWSDAAYAEVGPVIEAEWPTASRLPRPLLAVVRVVHRLRFGFDPAAARPVDAMHGLRGLPLAIVHGTDDRLVPVDHAHRLAEAAPWADTWIVPGAGHAAVYGTDPTLYALRLVDFLDESFRTAVAAAP